MFASLMPGFRDLRAALISGGLLVGSVYILFGRLLPDKSGVRPEILTIADLNKAMPTVLAILGCALDGSLYTTALEGVVDPLHRRLLHVDPMRIHRPLRWRLVASIVPFSPASRSRVLAEAGRFYDQSGTASATYTRDDFQARVLADVLWLEGQDRRHSGQGSPRPVPLRG